MLSVFSLNHLSKHLDQLIQGRLWLKVIIGLFLGLGNDMSVVIIGLIILVFFYLNMVLLLLEKILFNL